QDPIPVFSVPDDAVVPYRLDLVEKLHHFLTHDIEHHHLHLARHVHPHIHAQGLHFRIEKILVQIQGHVRRGGRGQGSRRSRGEGNRWAKGHSRSKGDRGSKGEGI